MYLNHIWYYKKKEKQLRNKVEDGQNLNGVFRQFVVVCVMAQFCPVQLFCFMAHNHLFCMYIYIYYDKT
jgi:hypothetical protein